MEGLRSWQTNHSSNLSTEHLVKWKWRLWCIKKNASASATGCKPIQYKQPVRTQACISTQSEFSIICQCASDRCKSTASARCALRVYARLPSPNSNRQIQETGSECDRNVFSFQKLVGEAAVAPLLSPLFSKPVIGMSSYVDPVLSATRSFVQLAGVKQQIHPKARDKERESCT